MSDQKPIALITGAADGIGWATARLFCASSYRVVLVDMDEDNLKRRAQELGEDSIGLACDVSKEENVLRVFEHVRKLGRLDALVNNAGIGGPHTPTTEQTVADFEKILGVHLTGTFLFSREAFRIMSTRGSGSIVNISSIVGIVGLPKRNSYGAAKAGIASMTKSMACEWASSGIRVNAVAPGFVSTPLIRRLHGGSANIERLERRIPLGRLGTPEEIASVILFLCSAAADYVTGTILCVDGGWTAFGDAGHASAPY